MSVLVAVLALAVGGLVTGTGPPAAAATGAVGTICYSPHVQNVGWMDWRCAGQSAGTVGRSLNLEAVTISATIPRGICARAFLLNAADWQRWVCRNDDAPVTVGTVGQNRGIEALEFRLEFSAPERIRGTAHMRDVGWQNFTGWEKKIVIGSPGARRPIEAFLLEVN
ncbi:hypothetical protein AB0K48_06430 [Nonomuraea sp. NPDC055795]